VRVLVDEPGDECERELVPGERGVVRDVYLALHRFDHRAEVRFELVFAQA
jgi:hypothetical protein